MKFYWSSIFLFPRPCVSPLIHRFFTPLVPRPSYLTSRLALQPKRKYADAILVPAPLYAAFFNDLDVRAKVNCVAVPTEHPEYKITTAALDKAKRECEAQGQTVRALLLTNPGNPLGNILSADEMHDLFWW